jgi:hypothetical protein
MTPKQMSLSMQYDAGFERHRKPTQYDVFLTRVGRIVPWVEPCAVIARYYPETPEPGAGVEPIMGVAPDSIATVWGRHVTDGEGGAYQPG